MKTGVKILAGLLVIIALIALGLFWPAGGGAEPDLFAPENIETSLSVYSGADTAKFDDIVGFTDMASSRDDLMSGKFLLSKDRLPWTFTVPIDWAKKAGDPETLNALQRAAMADPFLAHYHATGDMMSFRQAAFFLLDWQSFHQTRKQTSPLAWNFDNAQARASRLAYILSQARAQPELLSPGDTQSLIGLADFHIQRSRDPLYGYPDYNLADSPGYAAICRVLGALQSCNAKEDL